MTRLCDFVEIDRRFARSARLDADLNGTPPLVGYVLQASVAKSLLALAESQSEHRQGAFTWTGPYGGGKSSAALLLANLVAGKKENRKLAARLAGEELTAAYAKAFPEDNGPWKVVAVTGSRVALRETVASAAAVAFGWSEAQTAAAGESDAGLINAIKRAGASRSSGTLIVLDELGKLLEHEALAGGDIHLLQDLAEHATRSKGRLVVIGILHQAFDQYAARANRDARQEWAKVQGRFHDIAFLSGADETVALLGRAITGPAPPADFEALAAATAQAVARRRPTEPDVLTRALAATWPLNPVTALLLGPVSRARFAQNERSVFGFLSSAEPAGFQEFLATTEDSAATYGPDRLWDYLASNFGMALAAGHDGGRFSLAFEAIERAGAKGGAVHVALTKSAAALEFFRNGSGLALADDFLGLALPGVGDDARARAVADLLEWAILIKQPRLGGYALFAGSDFDLEDAITRATAPVDAALLEGLPQRVGFGFAPAKRHYFLTGALRTFEISLQVVSPGDTPEHLAAALTAKPTRGSGQLALVLGDGSVEPAAVEGLCRSAAKLLKKSGKVVALGAAAKAYALRDSAAELVAVERVLHAHPQLEGDRIARRELAARHSACIDWLHRSLETSLDEAKWWLAPAPGKPLREPLAIVASALADAGYPDAPILKSELLQRDRPSSNAMAALRDLCHAMVRRVEAAELGI
ncbi:MAG TPA: ATP-binding protein, partial [Caulobacteraceae bacterium]|nr:ATP-binding protein [Caulobacteraceae bacterium]